MGYTSEQNERNIWPKKFGIRLHSEDKNGDDLEDTTGTKNKWDNDKPNIKDTQSTQKQMAGNDISAM